MAQLQAATTRMSIGALLASVTSAATTVTTTLNALGDAAEALGHHSAQWAENTKLTCLADRESFTTELIARKAQEQADLQQRVNNYRNQSSAHAEAFDAAHVKFSNLLRGNTTSPTTVA